MKRDPKFAAHGPECPAAGGKAAREPAASDDEMDLGLNDVAEIRAWRVARLQRALRNGTWRPRDEQIAEAALAELFYGDFPRPFLSSQQD